jgi:tetratricopeptide (TPR) repeat protein
MQQSPASIDPTFVPSTDAATCYSRGEALANMGCYSEALAHFDRLLKFLPHPSKAWTFRSAVLIHLGRDQEALESCDRALSLNPNDLEAWTFRGVALQRLGQYREAYASYDRALGTQQRSLWHRLFGWMKR